MQAVNCRDPTITHRDKTLKNCNYREGEYMLVVCVKYI